MYKKKTTFIINDSMRIAVLQKLTKIYLRLYNGGITWHAIVSA